jgi:putative peptidoglycan lipid II flippase
MSQQAFSISLSHTAPPPAQPPATPRAEKRAANFVAHAKLISALTFFSRILGMARESVVATYFGATVVAQAFSVAFSIPNLFRKLLGEGALSAAFIPLYAQALKSGDEAEAKRFAAASVNLLAIILFAVTLVGEIVLWLTTLLIDLRPDNLLVVKFTAIMLPYVILVCGTAFLSGILQTHKRFGPPALTQIPLNLIHITVIVIGARLLLLKPGNIDQALQTRLAYWLCGFVLIAGVIQISMLMPSLRQIGFRFMWVGSFWTPAIKKLLILSIPVALSAGVLQISVILDKGITLFLTAGKDPTEKLWILGHAFNYPLSIGAAARLNWAQMLYQFPLGVFATAVATAIFPSLSADAHDRDVERFKRILRQGILFTLFEGLPASIGLILVRYPIVRLVFQHGSFTPADTQWVTMSVVFYSAAIWAFSLQQVLNRGYYALHDTMTPLVMSIITIAINTVVEIPLSFTRLGEAGIAAGTLASFALQAVVMLIMLDRRTGGLALGKIATSAAKMVLACTAMAGACLSVQHLPIYPDGNSHIASAIQLAILVVTGGATYLLACRILGFRVRAMMHPGDSTTLSPAPTPR